ncbi:MAG: cupin 2 domain-containing protein [Flavobacteriales bacterium]|jgi:cupin 2 domain-containing protein
MSITNLFTGLPSDFRDEVFDNLLECETLKIERITSLGHRAPQEGWFEQDWSEWVVVLEGEALLECEGSEPRKMLRGDFNHLPKGTRHRVLWTDPDKPTIWLAIHYKS